MVRADDDTEKCARCTILLVEDDADIRETLAMALEECGYHVMTAINGLDAIERIAATSVTPHLILLDWLMPVMSGLEFLGKHTESAELRGVPVVVLSAIDRVFDVTGETIAATMVKPVRMRTLVDVVDRLCNQPRRPNGFLDTRASGKVPYRFRDSDTPARAARVRAQTLDIRRRTEPD